MSAPLRPSVEQCYFTMADSMSAYRDTWENLELQLPEPKKHGIFAAAAAAASTRASNRQERRACRYRIRSTATVLEAPAGLHRGGELDPPRRSTKLEGAGSSTSVAKNLLPIGTRKTSSTSAPGGAQNVDERSTGDSTKKKMTPSTSATPPLSAISMSSVDRGGVLDIGDEKTSFLPKIRDGLSASALEGGGGVGGVARRNKSRVKDATTTPKKSGGSMLPDVYKKTCFGSILSTSESKSPGAGDAVENFNNAYG